ncbi:LysR family transcriptional regulator [Mesorhizobium sp. WSM4312]|uniref:LysR family transcriptional regulator n=1 Tax=unclassified Mesorhizobium TaxID=325217 RepID=UPI000BAF2355|nr:MULTISPECIES: LysR family transcriptional regulator [unclassified Mesorhizobium]PBB23326.1 LysR family transcriptional regulator [Mesorhizobium sp. WSM4304]PBB65534.1 LysR family transcriptional regulator [Mesorhizobium sp. WSM4312]PBB71897.1 LysR family transcriptional regulator [Mesorhizobium sp. WSM4308]PBC19201.1 LysR family transcriptional regulator [Mesorhizobium sp. WSM4311]TRC70781.1 LysR family transcriptional regulator [Mesorhizobium sp. WSM4315]
MADRLQELEVFVRVAERGNLSQVAREIGLSQPSVSRILNDLEGRIGARLLVRTSRKVGLTEAGHGYLGQVRPLLAELGAAADTAAGNEELRGLLRVELSVTFAVRALIPRLPGLLAEHPNLSIELMMDDRRRSLVEEGADVAVRLGLLDSSSLMVRKVGQTPRLLVASPDYIARRGLPQSPGDLVQHEVIFGPSDSTGATFQELIGPEANFTLPESPRIRVSSSAGVTACVLAGLGVAFGSGWMFNAELSDGRLRRLLPEFPLPTIPIHVLFPAGRQPSKRARGFADWLSRSLGSS